MAGRILALLLSAVLWFRPAVTQSKSELESACPETCHCPNKTYITCKNGQQDSTDIFLTITDTFYPELETLAISGNNFGELEAVNLFGPDVSHSELSKLDLVQDGITVLHADALEGAPNLEILDLTSNNLTDVQGDLFAQLPRLKRIFLSDAFHNNMSNEDISNLLFKMFGESIAEFTNLQQIYLDHNHLGFLRNDIFCKVKGLEILELNDNKLSSFNMKRDCLTGLRELSLHRNQIQYFTSEATANLTSLCEYNVHLQRIDISENPFVCDCYLAPFLEWHFEYRDLLARKDLTQCEDALPTDFAGVALQDVDKNKLKCPSDGSNYLHTVYIFISLAFIGLFMLIACLIYSNKGFFNKRRYNVVGGYHKLAPEDVEIKPEFV